VIIATNQYKDEMDLLGDFLAERCEIAENYVVIFKDLYIEYKAYCLDNGEDRPISRQVMGTTLQERGFIKGRLKSGDKSRVYKGLRLKSNVNNLFT